MNEWPASMEASSDEAPLLPSHALILVRSTKDIQAGWDEDDVPDPAVLEKFDRADG